jgi:hypothetical protein
MAGESHGVSKSFILKVAKMLEILSLWQVQRIPLNEQEHSQLRNAASCITIREIHHAGRGFGGTLAGVLN